MTIQKDIPIEECCKLYKGKVSFLQRESIYESIIDAYSAKNNIYSTIKAKYKADLLPVLVASALLWFAIVAILSITNPWINIVMILPLFVYGFILYICVKYSKDDRIIIDTSMKVADFFIIVKSKGDKYWRELETYYATRYTLELVGRPLLYKWWPILAVTMLPKIFIMILPGYNNIYIQAATIVIMIIVYLYIFSRTAMLTRLDKLAELIKEMARYKDNYS